MTDTTIYVKAASANITGRKTIYLSDVAKIYSLDKDVEKNLNQCEFYKIPSEKEKKYVFHVFQVFELIQKNYPKAAIENIGETDFVIHYQAKDRKSTALSYLKIIVVSLTAFFGAAFSIMTFNTDVSVEDVFSRVYELFSNVDYSDSKIVEISYSVGIFLGIMIFYNHFAKWKKIQDPTPVEVEMCTYEKDVDQAVIDEAQAMEES